MCDLGSCDEIFFRAAAIIAYVILDATDKEGRLLTY